MFAAILIIAFPVFIISCSKEKVPSGAEYELYGTWSRGPNPADTLYFLRLNNKNIMRHLETINAGLRVYSETEYKFKDGKLSLKYSTVNEYHAVTSFAWTQGHTEFQLLGFQLFSYLSSTTTIFTYRKI